VSGAVPGDDVLARVTRDRDRYLEAEVVSIVSPSPLRRIPACDIQERCGGCPLMPVDELRQQEAKHRFVVDALERIGRIAAPPVGPTVAPKPWLGYRTKIELTLGIDDGGRPVVGYHGARSAGLVDVSRCPIMDPRLDALLAAARGHFLDGPGRHDPILSVPGAPFRLTLRVSSSTDDRLVALRGPDGPSPSLAAFAREAGRAEPDLAGVVRIVAPPRRRGGSRLVTIAGRAWFRELILGTEFRVPAATFLQIHARAAELLGWAVIEAGGQASSAIELYGGVGGIGIALARRGARVTIVEADADAVACGMDAVERAGVEGVELLRGDVRTCLERTMEQPDVVIADPPRTGLGPGVAVRIADLAPRTIVMVSCDPATLARDVALLTARGYLLDSVTPFDLFPQTAHVEAVARLSLTRG
jgi:23S rRNA (uracil1939-C5)-methyltransferase